MLFLYLILIASFLILIVSVPFAPFAYLCQHKNKPFCKYKNEKFEKYGNTACFYNIKHESFGADSYNAVDCYQ